MFTRSRAALAALAVVIATSLLPASPAMASTRHINSGHIEPLSSQMREP